MLNTKNNRWHIISYKPFYNHFLDLNFNYGYFSKRHKSEIIGIQQFLFLRVHRHQCLHMHTHIRGVMFILVGNGVSSTSSNPGRV